MLHASPLRVRSWRYNRGWVVCALGLLSACFVDLGPEKTLGLGGGNGGTGATASDTTTSTSSIMVAGGGGEGAGGATPGDCTGEKVLWARQFGGESEEYATSTAPDGEGGVFVAGIFFGAVDLGGGVLQGSGFHDVFFARFDGNGEEVWSLPLGDPADQIAMFLTAAPSGEVVLAGPLVGTINFGDGPVTANEQDAVIARYDGDGELLWKKVYGGVGIQSLRGVAVDPQTGDIYLAGIYHNELIGLGDTLTNSGGAHAFIARLDASGEYVWRRVIVGAGPVYANGVAIDADGNIIVGGWADGDVDLGEGIVPTADAGGDAWAGLYHAETGDPIWTRLWPDPGHEAIRRATTDASGTPVIAGKFEGYLALDSYSADFSTGVFVAGLDSDGVAARAAIIGYGVDVATVRAKANGNLLVSGSFVNTLGTGNLPIRAVGAYDGMVVELDERLEPVSTIVLGSLDYDDFSTVSLAADGMHAFATANFQDTAFLTDCDRAFVSIGDSDFLLVALAP